jgi:zinc transporter 9
MGGILLLLALSVVMAVASFLAGSLPLSMTLSQSQLRFISSLGIGILVGTSLIVIIPEGIEAVAKTGLGAHEHGTRHVIRGCIEAISDGPNILDSRGIPPACDRLRRSPTPRVSITTRQDSRVDPRGCIEALGNPVNVSLYPPHNACDILVRSVLDNTASDSNASGARASDGCIEPLDARYEPSSCDHKAARGEKGIEARGCIEPLSDEVAARSDKPSACDHKAARGEKGIEARGCIEPLSDEVAARGDKPFACDPEAKRDLGVRGCIEAIGGALNGVQVRAVAPVCDKLIRDTIIPARAAMLEARGCIEAVNDAEKGVKARDMPPACDKKIRSAFISGSGADILEARGCIERRTMPIGVETRNLPPACDRRLRHKAKRDGNDPRAEPEEPTDVANPAHSEADLPTFFIGFSLMTGFVLMFLIDRLPRHATENLQSAPATRHISLDNLETSSVRGDDESEGFLGSLSPSRRQAKGFATTVGLVIHATADGIAMGASAVTEDMKLGFIIFLAIMIHKAPAAFGLTSVLLKQGLSKRAARVHLVAFSLAAPVGALTTYLAVSAVGGSGMQGEAGQWWTGMLLLFSGGTFLYVAMHAMQEDTPSGPEHNHAESHTASPRKQTRPQMRDTLATVVGMVLPLLTQFGHHH